jgi:hypothetical protein
MAGGPNPGRGHVDLAWIGFRVGDELGKRFDRKRWIDDHNIGRAHDAGNGRDVVDEIEIELAVQRCVDRVRKTGEQKRIAIRRRMHHGLGSDIAARTRPVLDDE